jgi:signal transduction histidine kinase
MNLSELIGQHGNLVVARWLAHARKQQGAEGLSDEEVVCKLPQYLAALCEHRNHPSERSARALDDMVVGHVGVRLREGFRVDEAVSEYALLGRCILEVWLAYERPPPKDFDWLFDTFDRAQAEVRRLFMQHLIEDEQVEKRYVRLLDQLASDIVRDDERDPRDLSLDRFLRILCDGVEAECGQLFLYDAKPGGPYLAAQIGNCLRMEPGERLPPGAMPAFEVLAVTDHVEWIHNGGEAAAHFGGRLELPEQHSLFARRLWSRDELLGIVTVSKHGDGALQARVRARLEVLGRRMAMLLTNLRLYQKVHQNMTDLRHERELRERFVAVLAHDLRSPLAAAKANAQLLEIDEDATPGVHRIAHKIIRSLNRTDRMIQDLLDANRIRAGEPLPLRLEQVDLGTIAREVLEEMNTVFGERFTLRVVDDVRGRWDPRELKRALWNLGSNAVKHGAPGGPVTITVDRSDDGAVVAVHNEGPPIELDRQRAIFEPFARGRNAATTRGWGLGLTLVKGSAEAHGGRVEVQSDEHGTTFRIHLPLDARPQPPAPGAPLH